MELNKEELSQKPTFKEFLLPNANEDFNLIFLVTGSVAAIKAGHIAYELYKNATINQISLKILIIISKSAAQFTSKEIIQQTFLSLFSDGLEFLQKSVGFFEESIDSEWNSWKSIGDLVLHIAARDWADAMLVAPLSANTLAKISQGFCDTLGTSILRAWDISSLTNAEQFEKFDQKAKEIAEDAAIIPPNSINSEETLVEKTKTKQQLATKTKLKPVFLAPAMNTRMWEHPFTKSQLTICETVLHFQIIPPISKKLACGEIGQGAMNEPDVIAQTVVSVLSGKSQYHSQKDIVSSLFN